MGLHHASGFANDLRPTDRAVILGCSAAATLVALYMYITTQNTIALAIGLIGLAATHYLLPDGVDLS